MTIFLLSKFIFQNKFFELRRTSQTCKTLGEDIWMREILFYYSDSQVAEQQFLELRKVIINKLTIA